MNILSNGKIRNQEQIMLKINKPAYQITLYTSFALWLISLCLPALGYYQQVYWGYELFTFGIVFGLLFFSIQPYTNLLFIFLSVSLLRKKSYPKLAFFNFVIALTSLYVIGDNPSWHWGSVCWFISYLLIIIASVQYQHDKENSDFNIIPYVVGLFVILFALSQYQYKIANSQERSIYYTKPLVTFVAKDFIDFPYQTMDNVTFKNGDLIEFTNGEIDNYFQRFEKTDKYSLELPNYFLHKDKVFLRINGYHFAKPLDGQKPNYKIEYYTENNLIGLKINNQNQQTIWQGLFKPNKGDSWAYQEPDYMQKLKEKFYKLNDYDGKNPNFEKMVFNKVNFSQTEDDVSIIFNLNTTPTPFEIYANKFSSSDREPVIAAYQSGDFVLFFTRRTYSNGTTYIYGVLIDSKNWKLVNYLYFTGDVEKDLLSDKWGTLFLTSKNKQNLTEKTYTIGNIFGETKIEKE